MTDPFIGEIRAVGFNFAPRGWALCNGQLMPISQNTALFSLLGVNYGGDGRSTFGLPDLQARFPLHAGAGAPGLTSYTVGESDGAETVTLMPSQMPAHVHPPQAVAAPGDSTTPAAKTWAQPRRGRVSEQAYAAAGSTVPMSYAALAPAGGSQPHTNMPPFLVVSFVIALEGIWPQRP